MAWFKVDDNYWSHPKVMFQSLNASGLWVRTASWAANHLTNGVVPVKVMHMIVPGHPRQVNGISEELADLGMWLRDGDDWVFHDWEQYQPTRSQVETERERQRERQTRWRQGRPRNGVSNGVTDGVSNGVSTSLPTRPDPTRSNGGPVGPPPITTADTAPSPCEHGSESASRCALCRQQERERAEQ